MDIILLIAGIVLIVQGAKRKDSSGQRSGGGIAMLTIGIVTTVVGCLWFLVGFAGGFASGLASSQAALR